MSEMLLRACPLILLTIPNILSETLINESLNHLEQTNIQLITAIKENYLVPPSEKEVKYNFSKKLEHIKINGQHHQAYIVNNQIFKNKLKNGFFIEAGAYDGEIASNTLLFELEHNWTGLLVEPNPDSFKWLTNKVYTYIYTYINADFTPV